MRTVNNRRLANVKTRHETGLDYVIQKLNIQTPFGRKKLKELRPWFPGEEDDLRAELDRVEALYRFAGEDPTVADRILECFMEMKDSSYTIKRAASSALSVVEVYEIKSLLLLMAKLTGLTKGRIPSCYDLEDTTELLDALDPRGDRINTFYVYDEFSRLLGELRAEKRQCELEIRRVQKETREEIRRVYGVQLTPKFDIVVAKSNAALEDIKKIPQLEITDEDYMSVTLRLKPTPETFGYMQTMESITGRIEEEEERILKELSEKIAAEGDRLNRNCERIGELDLCLAKALYARERGLTKPEIVQEHVIEIINGRNLQVEDILREKNKKYCPVSISLKDGVTLITGANMGGKTISLKLSGQVPILAQYGFFVPAERARVGLSNYMQMLIGDSQSVERGLSSFGSEMEELKEILDHGTDRSVIFMDEIASGTNPVEGFALTRSIVDYLKSKPYISLITTHFEMVRETEGVVNMQVVGLADANFELLDREIRYANRRERINIISKYMDYSLRRVENKGEVPKDALNIAKMLGIDQEIIEGAKKYINKGEQG